MLELHCIQGAVIHFLFSGDLTISILFNLSLQVFVAVIVLVSSNGWTNLVTAQSVTLEKIPDTQEISRSSSVSDRQQVWLDAAVDQRIKLAEAIGDAGAREYASARRWKPIFDGTDRSLLQGPDQVYRAGDILHVIEAKGGSGQLGKAYGYSQGSSEWAVESAKLVLRSTKSSETEQLAAKAILDAAAKGKLEVHVIRTSHVLGEPIATTLEQSVRCSEEATRLAKSTFDDLAKAASTVVDDAARATDDISRAAAKGTSVAKTASKVAMPLAVAVDAGLRLDDGIQTEQRFATGEITAQQREVTHAKNISGMLGGWGGAMAGAEIGTTGGAAAGTVVAPGPGTAVGGVVGGVAGGVAGYIGGEKAAEAAAEWAVNQVHAAGTTIADTAEKAWNKTTKAASEVFSSIHSGWNYLWGN